MNKIWICFFCLSLLFCQTRMPVDFWNSMDFNAKVAFVNGAYSAASALKSHHQHQVDAQYKGNKNWVQPYYIDRYYEIVDEHISTAVDGNLDIIVKGMDALYSNSDNAHVPVMEALRIVSMVQDGQQQKANLYLLKAQRKK